MQVPSVNHPGSLQSHFQQWRMFLLGSQPARVIFFFFKSAPFWSLKTCLKVCFLFKVVSSNENNNHRDKSTISIWQWKRLNEKQTPGGGKVWLGWGNGRWTTDAKHFEEKYLLKKKGIECYHPGQENQLHVCFEKTIYFFPNIIPNMCFTSKDQYGLETF